VGEEAEYPEAVVQGQQHHPPLGQVALHEHRVAARSLLERAAVDPHHHRQVGGAVGGRSERVQAQAVLAHRLASGGFGVDRFGIAALIFQRDLAAPAEQRTRRDNVVEMIVRYVRR
jgi:hypothetical protein